MCADNNWMDHVSLKDAPGTDDDGLDRGSGEMGLGAKTSKSVVDEHGCFRGDEGHYDLHANQDSGLLF